MSRLDAILTYKDIGPGYENAINGELGSLWFEPSKPPKMVQFMIDKSLIVSVPTEHLLRFVKNYSNVGEAAIANFTEEDIQVE